MLTKNINGVCFLFILKAGFSDVFARFHFKRRTSYIILQVYFPSMLITLLSFIAFWIPKTAVPARITLSVTSVLTIIYFESEYCGYTIYAL